MSDDGFHEIQLNGKQLVFLFMAATVVAVVIFLCGVMVGRGVQAQRAIVLANTSADETVDPTAPAQVAPPSAAAATGAGAPITAQETLTYPDRLEEPTPPVETLATATDADARAAAFAASSESPSENVAATPDVETALAEPAGDGFVVQVAAVRARAEAETIARRLNGKGYPTFVTTPGTGAAGVFRVRVGKYDNRREAESIAGRLEREEHFKPWITR